MQDHNDAQDRLREIRCWLLDMDGTVTMGEEPLPGAHAFFDVIRDQDYLFLTNNSSHDANHYVSRLNRAGIRAERSQVLTSTDALALFLNTVTPDGRQPVVYPVGTPGFEKDLQAAGIVLEKRRAQKIDYVVLGFDTTLVYEKLDIACDYIRSGVPYLAANPDKVCPLAGGKVLPDCGALIAFMETCTDQAPRHIIGKPETAMIDMVMRARGYLPSQMAMVGDRLYTDLASAHRAGILGIVVLSGEATPEAICQSPVKPDLVYQDIGALAASLAELFRTRPQP